MQDKRWFVGAIIVLLALAAGFGSWRIARDSGTAQCYACSRPIHAHTRTVATVNGHSRLFCCPACALSEHRQENKPVKVTQLTSFLTGATLSPEDAYVVRGSTVNMCMTTQGAIGADKQRAEVRYDRCAPGILAFAQRGEAEQFARAKGGSAMPFADVASALAR